MLYKDVIKHEIQALYPENSFDDKELEAMAYQLVDFFLIMVRNQLCQNPADSE